MDMKDLNELRGEFEAMQAKNNGLDCGVDGSCISDEESREDYPDYLRAIYAEVMPPVKSGIYFSRWDLKRMAAQLDESFAIDTRERMFQRFMQWIATPEDMKNVIEQFTMLMDAKTDEYKNYSAKYPSTKEMFDKKIEKAEKSKQYLNKVYVEFFT